MGQGSSEQHLATLSADLGDHQARAAKYLTLQKHLLSLAHKHKRRLVRAAVSGHADEVARLAAATAPGHELDKCNHIKWDHESPLGPRVYNTQWYSVVELCAVLGHVEEMDAVLAAWVPRGLVGGELATDGGPASEVLISGVTGHFVRTPLVLAAINGHAECVRRLMGRWGAGAGKNLAGFYTRLELGEYHSVEANILHLAVSHCDLACIDAIMSEADEAKRVLLVGMEAGGATALEMALKSSCNGLSEALANPKWGESVIQAMDSRFPILYYSKHGYYNEDTLNHLCMVFSRGLAAAYLRSSNSQSRYIIAKHPKFAQSIDEILPKTGDTALYKATIKGDTKTALEALSLGANPNIQCRRNPKWGDYPEELRTPIVMAVASGQRSVVREMARHGGVLPLAYCNRIGDSAFSLASFIDGSWDQHVAMNKNFRESLPAAKWNSELRGSMPAFELPFISSQIEFTPAAQIQVDMSLTQLMVQFNIEITGVMELLDIQSLGRVQQTSRFWYQCGRANDLWRRALFNSSREWTKAERDKVDKCLELLPEATTKWKHVCFFWTSKNMCTKCRQVYRNRDPVPQVTKSAMPTTSLMGRHVHHPLNARFFSGATLLYEILQTH